MRGILIVALAVMGACEPNLGIDVTQTNGKISFAFLNCRDGSNFPIDRVSVIDRTASNLTESAHEVCALKPPAGPVGRIAKWDYGSSVQGFATQPCEQLHTGQTYTVVVSRPYAARRFRLNKDSSVSMLDPTCP